MSVKIIVDSACDISQEEARGWDVTLIPLKTVFGDEEFLDGVTMSHDEFFEKLTQTDVFPQTSQIPPFEYAEYFKNVCESKDTAVCITISSRLSGCYQSAMVAAAEYGDRIQVVDSENASLGERLVVQRAAELRDEGKSAGEIAEILNKEKKNIRLIALLDTLEYLKKGGRISAATALVGSVLSIKPVIAVDGGEVKVLGKARGLKNGNNLLTELVEKEGGICFSMPYCLAYSGASDQLIQQYIKAHERLFRDHVASEEIPITSIGSAIGTHIGPGAIGAAFFVSR